MHRLQKKSRDGTTPPRYDHYFVGELAFRYDRASASQRPQANGLFGALRPIKPDDRVHAVTSASLGEWAPPCLAKLFVAIAEGLSEFFKLGGSDLRFPSERVVDGEDPPTLDEQERLPFGDVGKPAAI